MAAAPRRFPLPAKRATSRWRTTLLGAGAAVDKADSDGYTPLFVACLQGHAEVATVLLGAGAAVDGR